MRPRLSLGLLVIWLCIFLAICNIHKHFTNVKQLCLLFSVVSIFLYLLWSFIVYTILFCLHLFVLFTPNVIFARLTILLYIYINHLNGITAAETMRLSGLSPNLTKFMVPPPRTFCQVILHDRDRHRRNPALYAISVRQTRGLLTASFRFHLTMDTLAVQLYTSHYLGMFGTFTC